MARSYIPDLALTRSDPRCTNQDTEAEIEFKGVRHNDPAFSEEKPLLNVLGVGHATAFRADLALVKVPICTCRALAYLF